MSKIISVLERMASDAAMNGESAIADLVATSDINEGQIQAIQTKDTVLLINTTNDLPIIECFVIVPAEDDEPDNEQQEDKNTKASNCA